MYAAYQRQARPGIASTSCYQTLLCLLFAPSFPPLCTVSAVVVLVISTICWLDFQLFFLVVLFRSPSLACSLCKKVTFGLNFLRACPPAFSVLIKILSDLILFLSALICDCKRVFSASFIFQYYLLSCSHFFINTVYFIIIFKYNTSVSNYYICIFRVQIFIVQHVSFENFPN